MKIKRNNRTIQNEGNKNRRNAIRIAIIGGVFTFIIALIQFFKPDKIPGASEIQVDKNNGNITNIEGDYYDNPPPVDATEREISYNVTGVIDMSFITFLRNSTKLNISPTSENRLNITYSNEIKPVANSPDIFYYGGGNIIIQLNGNICAALVSMPIEELRPNSRTNIERKIEEIISIHVVRNKNYFKDEILKCVQ